MNLNKFNELKKLFCDNQIQTWLIQETRFTAKQEHVNNLKSSLQII